MSTPRRFAVMGHPIAHSRSPRIHQLFAQQFSLALDYRAIDVAPGEFETAVRGFQEQGGSGMNITVPYKEQAWALADTRTGRAELAGAVNTYKFSSDGRIHADNTDGIGLVRDLAINLDTTLFDRRILVIGAGGAVRGILGALLEQGVRRLVLANRTVSKAQTLAKIFSTIGVVEPCPLEAVADEDFDIIINATAASLDGQLPAISAALFARAQLVYDLMYANEPTAFLRWAEASGAARLSDGLGMLVEQAAESFQLWFDRHPATAPVLSALRSEG